MNVPGCYSIPVVPCAVPVLPVMESDDSNCASPLLYLPLPCCSHCVGPSVFYSFTNICKFSAELSLKGEFLNTNDVCGSTRTFKLWVFEARVPIVLIAELQSVAVWGKSLIMRLKTRSTSILHCHCEDDGGPGRVSVISVAFMKNVCYHSLTFPANESN